MREFRAFDDKANDAIARAKIELGLAQVEQQLQHAYEEAKALEWGEAKQGAEGAEEDEDSKVSNDKKPRKVVITDEATHREEMEYNVKVEKRRLFDSVCRAEIPPVKRAEIFKALIS